MSRIAASRLQAMLTRKIALNTGRTRRIVDLTGEVAQLLHGKGDGLVNVFVPHATAGLAVMELGAGSESDLWSRLDSLLPRDDRYVHAHGSEGHGADHILPAFLAPSLTLPVLGGKVALGIWQSIVLVDPNVDNDRREVLVCFISSPE
jgi:secondary thiamine-phosphate synthase enzyme